MVLIELRVKGDLQFVKNLRPKEDIVYFLKLQCGHCGEAVNDGFVGVSPTTTVESKTSRSETNLLVKCKMCQRVSSLDVIPLNNNGVEEPDRFYPLVRFDSRGMEILSWDPRDDLVCNVDDDNYEKEYDVDLSEGDWTEFDEHTGNCLGIFDIAHELVAVKK